MEKGSSYDQALTEAQSQGYAEADPSDDVNGKDAAAKMAILTRLAFGAPISLDQIPYEGIEHLQSDDLQYARELGLSLKLLGVAERIKESPTNEKTPSEDQTNEGLSVRVYPAFLYAGHPLSDVQGSFNALTIESDSITEVTLSGPGAGGAPTASSVLGDMVNIMTQGVPLPRPQTKIPILEDIRNAFYIHMEVADEPGVLADITRTMSDNNASIKSVIQRGVGEDSRLIMVTHSMLESDLFAALKQMNEFDFVHSTPRAIRVIEEP
jgi:homoserine dehydrogenase